MEVAVDGTWVGDGVDVPGGVAPVVTGVDAGVGVVAACVGAGGGVPGTWRGTGPMPSPHSAPAWASSLSEEYFCATYNVNVYTYI